MQSKANSNIAWAIAETIRGCLFVYVCLYNVTTIEEATSAIWVGSQQVNRKRRQRLHVHSHTLARCGTLRILKIKYYSHLFHVWFFVFVSTRLRSVSSICLLTRQSPVTQNPGLTQHALSNTHTFIRSVWENILIKYWPHIGSSTLRS